MRSAQPGQNVFFSPFSITTALTMTWGGAKGETAEQAVLRAATAAGTVREFSPVRPHLADLFRGVVVENGAAA
mgnify:CR=1 FL=1